MAAATICSLAAPQWVGYFVSFDAKEMSEVSLRMLGDNAFEGCTSLIGFVLPNMPDYIGQRVFAGWTKTQEMLINQTKEEVLQILESGIFKDCQATICDKDFQLIHIDPETGLAVTP